MVFALVNIASFWPSFFKSGANVIFCNSLDKFYVQKKPLRYPKETLGAQVVATLEIIAKFSLFYDDRVSVNLNLNPTDGF